MNTTTAKKISDTTTSILNPLLVATNDVFEMMLGCTPSRQKITLKNDQWPTYYLSSVIAVTGQVNGTIVLSLPIETALKIHNTILGAEAKELDNDVLDSVGEITNMIAGNAKSKLDALDLNIGIPNIISGRGHEIHYPTDVLIMHLGFSCNLGVFSLEAGFTAK